VVILKARPRTAPCKPISAISRSTVQRATSMPSRTSCRQTLSAPYTEVLLEDPADLGAQQLVALRTLGAQLGIEPSRPLLIAMEHEASPNGSTAPVQLCGPSENSTWSPAPPGWPVTVRPMSRFYRPRSLPKGWSSAPFAS